MAVSLAEGMADYSLAAGLTAMGNGGSAIEASSVSAVVNSLNSAPFAASDEYELVENETLVAPGQSRNTPQYRETIVQHAPVAFWRLGEAIGPTAMDLVSNHHGQYLGDVALVQPGALAGDVDTAARFDGTGDSVLVADAEGLRPSGALSVEAWIYADSGSPSYASPIMKTTSSAWTDGYGLFYQSGAIRFFVNHWSSSRVSASISPNQWHHVVGTFDAGTLRIYVNGVLGETASVGSTIQHSTNVLRIGEGEGGYSWMGAIDEVAVYDRALTESEIASHHAAGSQSSVRIVDADKALDAPTDVGQMWYSPDFQTLTMVNATGVQAILLDAEHGTVFDSLQAEARFADVALSPDSRYLFFLDITNAQSGTTGWIRRYDLATRTSHRQPVDAAALGIAAVDGNTIAMIADAAQPAAALYRFDAASDGAIVELDHADLGLTSSANLAIRYDAASNRVYALAAGDEIAIAHWQVAGNVFANESRVTHSIAGDGPILLSAGGEHLYVGVLQFTTADLSSAPRVFPSIVLAADARAAYSSSGIYGTQSTARWGQLAQGSGVVALDAADRQLWTYHSAKVYRHAIPVGEGPLANDDDPDGDSLIIEIVEPPAHGSVRVTDDGGFRYTPNSGFVGTDQFAYRASDGTANSESANVALHVKPLVPTAAGDDYVLAASAESEVAAGEGILANDSDPHGRPLATMLIAGPSHGALTLAADGAFRYQPNDGFVGVDSFTYRAASASGASKAATVLLSVTEPNVPPVAVDDHYSLEQGTTLVVDHPGSRFAVYADAVRADNPIGYWRLGETTGDVAADETEGHPGQYTGNILRGQSGALAADANTSITLDGSGGVILVPHDAAFDTTELTVEAWIRPQTGIGLYDAVVTKTTSSAWTDGYGLYASSSGNIVFFVNDYSSKSISVPVPRDEWQHIVGTFDGGTLRLYRNGVLAASRGLSESIVHSIAALRIGQGEASSSYTWTGGLDEVAIYGHALSAAAIEDHYNAAIGAIGGAGAPSGPASPSPGQSFGVLNNDIDDDSERLSATLVSGPAHGDLTLNVNGTFRYTPYPQFFGEESFTYRASDGLSDSNIATVTLDVVRAPTPPSATADAYATSEDAPLSVLATAGVLSNDVDPDGKRLSALLVEPPTHGKLVMLPSGAFRYTPAANYFGSDSFTYRADNGELQSSSVVVSLLIAEVNDPPATVANVYATAVNSALAAANDAMPPPDLIVADSLADYSGTQGQNGWYYGYFNRSTDADGQYETSEFVAFPNSGGPWSATNYYNASSATWNWFNGNPPWTNFNFERMHPNGTNTGPEHWAIRRWMSDVSGPVVLAGEIAKSDSGIGGDGIRGTIFVDGAPVFAVNIAGTNRVGESFEIPLTLAVGTIVDFVVAPNGSDSLDSTRFVARITRGEALPTATTILPRGVTWKYRDNLPNGVAYPVDAEGHRWSDADYDDAAWPAGHAILGYDTIDAGPIATLIDYGGNPTNKYRTALFRRSFAVEDARRIGVLLVEGLFDDGAAIYINGREVLRYNLPGAAGDGALTTNTLATGAGSEATYVKSLVNLASFDDLLVDGENTIAVEIHQMRPDSSDLGFDLELSAIELPAGSNAGVLANDTDVEGNSLTASLIAGPYHGMLVFAADGTFTYTPDSGFKGVDQFTYRASDGSEDSAATLVTINVGEANAAPIAADDRYVARSGTALTVATERGVFANDFDVNGDRLTASVFAPPTRGTLTLAADGSFVYTPQGSFIGLDSFAYRVADDSGALGFATAMIHIVPQLDPINGIPLAGEDSFATTATRVLFVASPGVLANDHDPERRSIFAIVDRAPWHGPLSFASDGSFTYTPLPGFTGTDTFTYRATDGNSFSAPATVVINVSAATPVGGLPAPGLPNLTLSSSISPESTQKSGSLDTPFSPGTLPITGDFNGDGRVDRTDLAIVVAAYGVTSGSPAYRAIVDMDGDGRVSLADAIALRNRMFGSSQRASSSALLRRASNRFFDVPSNIDVIVAATSRLRRATFVEMQKSHESFLRVASSGRARRVIAPSVSDVPCEIADRVLASDADRMRALAARRTRAQDGED
ncbi:MAG: Ig-like domain-containing protein [Pirellulales bacterium]